MVSDVISDFRSVVGWGCAGLRRVATSPDSCQASCHSPDIRRVESIRINTTSPDQSITGFKRLYISTCACIKCSAMNDSGWSPSQLRPGQGSFSYVAHALPLPIFHVCLWYIRSYSLNHIISFPVSQCIPLNSGHYEILKRNLWAKPSLHEDVGAVGSELDDFI
jgi:hypothetical protein